MEAGPEEVPTLTQSETGDPTKNEGALQSPLGADVFRVGRYAILEVVGSGGMGVVYSAYDPELDRKVALKFFYGSGENSTADRARREAQALARLSHPNVVHVYEVGEHEEQLYLAMEFVQGESLRDWLKKPRRREEILEVLVGAGRGLAAAHEAGLIHRDFKPENVLVEPDGTARVVDFGLARGETTEDELLETDGGESLGEGSRLVDRTITRGNQVIGTPAYMAPEQCKVAGNLTAKSDQFAFCLTAYEALYGERPFPGRTLRERLPQIRSGPPRMSGWPFALLARGMAWEPDQRWPSMEEVIGGLVHDGRALATRRILLGGGLVLAVGLGYGLAIAQPEVSTCEVPSVWDEAAKSRARDGILGTEVIFAESTWERVDRRMSEVAEALRQGQLANCERKDITENVRAGRAACLAAQQGEFAAMVDALDDVGPDSVPLAIAAVEGLPDPARCLDAKTREGSARKEVVEVQTQVRAVMVAAKFGDLEASLEKINPLVEQARVIGDPLLLSEATVAKGLILSRSGAMDESRKLAHEGLALALEHGFEVQAAQAFSLLLFVGFDDNFGPEDALALEEMGLALGRRAGPRAELEMEATFAQQHMYAHHYARAVEKYRRIVEIADELYGADSYPASVRRANGAGALNEGGYAQEALQWQTQVLGVRQKLLGSDHPQTAMALAKHAAMIGDQGDLSLAEQEFKEASRILGAIGDSHPGLILCEAGLASILANQRRFDEALVHFDRALETSARVLGPNHPVRAALLSNLGDAHAAKRDWAQAYRVKQEMLTFEEARVGTDSPHLIVALTRQATTFVRGDALEDAARTQARALALLDGVDEETIPAFERWTLQMTIGARLAKEEKWEAAEETLGAVAQGIDGDALEETIAYQVAFLRGTVALGDGRIEDARALLQSALDQWDSTVPELERLAAARLALARAWASPPGADPARARKLAEQARDDYSQYGESYVDRATEVRGFLKALD